MITKFSRNDFNQKQNVFNLDFRLINPRESVSCFDQQTLFAYRFAEEARESRERGRRKKLAQLLLEHIN